MKALLIIAIAALIAVPAAQAGKITVSAEPVGSDLAVTVCNSGKKTVGVNVTSPSGEVTTGELRTDFPCATMTFRGVVAESGEYLVEVTNLQRNNVFASTTVLVP